MSADAKLLLDGKRTQSIMEMDFATQIVRSTNELLWGMYCLIPLLVGTGIYMTIRLRFVQLRKFGDAFRQVFGGFSLFGKAADGSAGMSSFQSLATAISAQVGTGNLAGVATAMVMGGPGAIFWMWLAAFFGMATIFSEAVLAQTYRLRDDHGHILGGPAIYISRGLGNKTLAAFFAVAIILALGFIGNMVQANSIADAFLTAFSVPQWLTGILIFMGAGFIFIGGIRRIAAFAEKMVPIMALIYIIGSLTVIFGNAEMILPAFKSIFIGAFDPTAATGGLIGAGLKEAIRYGVARGLFSNEAGMGSTPHAHALARVQHPMQQGLAAIVGLTIDTFLVLNMTAFVILCTGTLNGQTNGIALTQAAFTAGLGAIGPAFVAICLLFFAFTTIIGWFFFGEQNVKYLFGLRGVQPYRVLVLCFLMMGSFLHVNLVWELADFFNGIMVIPNVIALLCLSGLVAKIMKDYEVRFTRGETPEFGPMSPGYAIPSVSEIDAEPLAYQKKGRRSLFRRRGDKEDVKQEPLSDEEATKKILNQHGDPFDPEIRLKEEGVDRF